MKESENTDAKLSKGDIKKIALFVYAPFLLLCQRKKHNLQTNGSHSTDMVVLIFPMPVIL